MNQTFFQPPPTTDAEKLEGDELQLAAMSNPQQPFKFNSNNNNKDSTSAKQAAMTAPPNPYEVPMDDLHQEQTTSQYDAAEQKPNAYLLSAGEQEDL
jgi:hypothetical protein